MINTISCNPDEAKELIKRLRNLKLSFMLWGATGVGKSECVRQLADELGADLRDVRLCQKQPTDIAGLPALDHERKQTVFYPPSFLAPSKNEKGVILFFDEISLAPDDTRSAVLGILEERKQGDIEIPDDWIIVAAGNRPEDLANARGLGAAANRRLLHIVIEPQLEATLAHFIKIKVAPEVLAFLKVFPQHLSGEESARQQKHELYPRPASWKKVSDVYDELRKSDKNLRGLAVAGIIGDSVATEFMMLAEEIAQLKSVEELLEINRRTPKRLGEHLPATLNGLYALAFAIATSATESKAVEMLELINRFDEQKGAQFALLPMRDLQTMAGSLLLDKIWKEGWKVEHSEAFWQYNEKRESAGNNQDPAESENQLFLKPLFRPQQPSPRQSKKLQSRHSRNLIPKIMQTRLSRAESRRMRPDLESAIEHLPGLASLALWCRFADTDDDEIAYTDGLTVYAGAKYAEFDQKKRRFICLHEILHIALCHPQRGEQLKRRDLDFNHELLNVAADAIINSSLENLTGLETPSDAWTLTRLWQLLDETITEKEKAANQANLPASASNVITLHYSYGTQSQSKKIANLTRTEFTSANRWSCEELYYFLKAQAQTRVNFLTVLVAVYGKDSLGGDLRLGNAGGERIDFDARAIKSKPSETRATNETREWQQRLSLLRGTVPELFQRLAGELPKVETPWEQILRSVVQTVFQETTVNDYSRPSRRWLAMERNYSECAGVNLPFAPAVKKKRGTRLAVALDTSGSIDESLLTRFLAEIAALLAFNQRNLILLIGDAKLHSAVEIDWRDAAAELANTVYTGGGGTDFRPIIEAAAEYEPDALVYLTDLFGECGDAPGFPVVWATHGVCGTAPWGDLIKLK